MNSKKDVILALDFSSAQSILAELSFLLAALGCLILHIFYSIVLFPVYAVVMLLYHCAASYFLAFCLIAYEIDIIDLTKRYWNAFPSINVINKEMGLEVFSIFVLTSIFINIFLSSRFKGI